MRSDEIEEELLYSDASQDGEDAEDPLEDDEISPEEEGFMKGYEEANEPETTTVEEDEEEL